ncbi:DUF2933 domain-containing protein [Hydrogenophaga taeniospiralis]|uniref:DUF2933 domain-containing protein n=1 Tax=Hydrogenophaga taeniospiralis TaxID=65656 RepID=UPI001CFBF0B1|nr:DUF2933 domain-containing protein [Hydrogenophaga taeniospiralis]UCU93450.1 DUF2933 domain-containing protein [Hydrogenophaga taeniospiralis]
MNHQTPNHAHEPRSLWRTRYGVGLLVLGAVAAFFLFAEHRAHIFGALPFLLILACPLMHLFMHHGHGAQGHHTGADQPRTGAEEHSQTNQGDRS